MNFKVRPIFSIAFQVERMLSAFPQIPIQGSVLRISRVACVSIDCSVIQALEPRALSSLGTAGVRAAALAGATSRYDIMGSA